MTIRKVRDGERVTVHANPDRTKAGSRFYIHARNVAAALLFLLDKGEAGEKYNIVGEKEVDNLMLAETIAAAQGKPLHHEMVDFHSARPGHDLRYALSGEKMASMGWTPPLNFEMALDQVVRWTLANERWLL
jgi:dTDP-glucose 4,6-dehydratase